jgi:predicted translin family RNA/ssDNA-binding protein
MTDEITRAEKVLGELQAKRETLAARSAELKEQRTQYAFAAHTGNEKARAKLDTVNREAAILGSELASLRAATREATVRVERAREAASHEKDRANAVALLTRVAEISETMIYVDKHIAHAVRGLTAVHQALEDVRALSGGHPSWMLVKSNAERAIKTALQRLPSIWWRDWMIDLCAPGERRTFSSFWQGMSASLERNARQRLGEKPKDKTTEAA